MSDIPIVSNPLGWALLQLVGGWRRVVMIAGAYALGMVVVGTLIYRGMQQDITLHQFASGGMALSTFVQVGMFFLVAPNLIRKAILRDFTTDMITSHRLSAMSGHTAVLGYVTGATAQIMALSIVNWVACNVFMLMSGTGPSQAAAAPTMLFAVMGILAVTCWTLAVLIALSTRGKTSVNGLLVTFGIAANVSIIAVLPGLDLLLVVVQVGQLAQARSQQIEQISIFVSILFQCALALVFFLAAARKFFRDDVQAFTPILAYALLAIWTLLCATALRFWPATEEDVWSGMFFAVDPRNQLLVTLASLLLMACLPVAGAARAEARWAERAAKDARFAPARPRRYFTAALLSALVVFSVFVPVTTPILGNVFSGTGGTYLRQAPYILIAFVFTLLTMAGVMRYAYSLTPNGMLPSVLVVVLLWAMPPFADLALAVMGDRPSHEAETVLFTMSPIGVWVASIRNLPAPIVPGLVVQGLLAAGAMVLASRSKYAGSAGRQVHHSGAAQGAGG